MLASVTILMRERAGIVQLLAAFTLCHVVPVLEAASS